MAKARPRKPRPVPDLIRRQRAIDKTMQRFAGRKFRLGKADCVIMARAHLVAMGHRKLPRLPAYSSPGGSIAAIEKMGAKDVEGLLDQYLTRIPPAAMLPGDVGLTLTEPDAPAWRAGTIAISLGRKYLTWHADHELLAIIEPLVDAPFTIAWRA